ncbi:hypothetical protein [Bradyrhizobium lablabi]|uniref:hypothetical protein n=1 Tax=Bradyrhizobium lablabi TaxID=722472 RepID=UPI001BA8F7B5|nr:hypothetical protein [Bradyrhizobium lablabi]MBR0695626.1 hypothetical protein [Bradyrhizobium lablabi]
MNSTPNPKATEPDELLVTRADERLAHAYEQIARADEQLARLNEKLSKLEQDATRHPSAVPGRRPPRGRPPLRGFIGLLLAASIFAAAFVSQSSVGDAAKLAVAGWASQVISVSSRPSGKPGLPAQQESPSVTQVAAAEPVAPQPTPSAQAAPQDVAATAAPVPPELAQMLQTMARDLANVQQGIEQLKASQEQTAQENAKVAEQLKVNQEQMTRLIAKASEQDLPRTSAPPPRPVATSTRKPVSTLPSPQARAQSRAPLQLRSEEQ